MKFINRFLLLSLAKLGLAIDIKGVGDLALNYINPPKMWFCNTPDCSVTRGLLGDPIKFTGAGCHNVKEDTSYSDGIWFEKDGRASTGCVYPYKEADCPDDGSYYPLGIALSAEEEVVVAVYPSNTTLDQARVIAEERLGQGRGIDLTWKAQSFWITENECEDGPHVAPDSNL